MADTTIKHVKDSLLDDAGNQTVFYNRNTVTDVMVGDTSEETIQGHINYLATCSTAAATAAKTITVGDGTTDVLKKGVSFDITFTNGNTAATTTMSVNGKAAVSLKDVTATTIKAGQTVHFVYNGTALITSGGSGSGAKVTESDIVGTTSSATKYVAQVSGADDNSAITFDKNVKVTKDGLVAEVGASTVTFSDQSASANTDYRTSAAITSKEKLSTTLGKIKKTFAGLGALAFKPSVGTTELDTTLASAYNNRLSKTDLYEGLDYATAGEKALDAKAGLTLQNGLTELNSKVTDIDAEISDLAPSIEANGYHIYYFPASFIPASSGDTSSLTGTIDISSYPGYQDLTETDIIPFYWVERTWTKGGSSGLLTQSWTYDNTTGIITITTSSTVRKIFTELPCARVMIKPSIQFELGVSDALYTDKNHFGYDLSTEIDFYKDITIRNIGYEWKYSSNTSTSSSSGSNGTALQIMSFSYDNETGHFMVYLASNPLSEANTKAFTIRFGIVK